MFSTVPVWILGENQILNVHLLDFFPSFWFSYFKIFLGTYSRGLTALHASSEEVTEWLKKNNPDKDDVSRSNNENRLLQSQEATSSGSNAGGFSQLQSNKPISTCSKKANYPFISECFFMTARVLNLGLLKGFSDFKHLVQVI